MKCAIGDYDFARMTDVNYILQFVGVAMAVGICVWYVVRRILRSHRDAEAGCHDSNDNPGCSECKLREHCSKR